MHYYINYGLCNLSTFKLLVILKDNEGFETAQCDYDSTGVR